ncbi:MAG: ABC transporter permease subunit [Christensenellales bacterium]|jgi:simple sugar transport system permease protein
MKTGWRNVLVAALSILGVVCIVIGAINMPKRTSEEGLNIIQKLRVRSLLSAVGDGVVDSYIAIAKKNATAEVKKKGGSMSDIRKAVQEAEEKVRLEYQDAETNYLDKDVTDVKNRLEDFDIALGKYADEKVKAEREYREAHMAEAEALAEKKREEASAQGLEAPPEETITVDMSGFEATEQMIALRAEADEAYKKLGLALMEIEPQLSKDALITLQQRVESILYHEERDFATLYDGYSAFSGTDVLDDVNKAKLIRYADDFITVGVALLIAALAIFFYETIVRAMGVPRLIISLFFVLLCVGALLFDLSLPALLGNTVVRMGMNSIMVLAMFPGIQCGISLNLGLPIGLVAGLLGGLMAIEFEIPGVQGFVFALATGSAIAAVAGYFYAKLLNRLKGSEMSVTTYVGFSIVSLMSIAWLMLPFNSLKLRWPLGTGLRNTIGLDKSNFWRILDNFLAFNIGGFRVPTGLLLFMAVCCFLVWLFSRSKTGIAMRAVGNNRRFAQSTGVNVDKMRTIGTVLSTVLGAIGILVYSQSYGFMQLYTAPRQMGFVAASAILIGGASTTRAKISHVIIGTFLFQGVLTLGMPVANELVPGSTISETMRILISNGIILYALTKSGGDTRG